MFINKLICKMWGCLLCLSTGLRGRWIQRHGGVAVSREILPYFELLGICRPHEISSLWRGNYRPRKLHLRFGRIWWPWPAQDRYNCSPHLFVIQYEYNSLLYTSMSTVRMSTDCPVIVWNITHIVRKTVRVVVQLIYRYLKEINYV